MGVGQLLGLLEFPGKDQLANPREMLVGFRIVVVMGAARPEGGLVERDALLAWMPPKTMAPMWPLPMGRASSHFAAGWRYHSTMSCAGAGSGAAAASVAGASSHNTPARVMDDRLMVVIMVSRCFRALHHTAGAVRSAGNPWRSRHQGLV